MRTHQALLPLLLSLALCPLTLTPQIAPSAAARPHIVYSFEHPQLQPSHYTFTIAEDGRGRFVSETGSAPQSDNDIVSTPIDRSIQLDPALTADLFRYARGHSFFATRCSNDHDKLAFTGNKTLAYTGPDGHGSCSFVWASDPALQRLSDQLGAVAFTIQIGQRLEVEVRHDRLGLDAELATLQDAVKDHRAGDLPNIANQLQAIVADQEVMNRARKRAEALLASCESQPRRTE
jgi:hypothetical protein